MTKKTRFVGDIHGDYRAYLSVISGSERSVQIGDFGMGFGYLGTHGFVDDMLMDENGEHRFIRGNHDNPAECKLSKFWIPDGTIEGDVMFLGGASSIDMAWRTQGLDWWHDEELSNEELNVMIDIYDKNRPRIMITHETTEYFARNVMIPTVNGNTNFPSRTREALSTMYSIKPPEIHIFGHWHVAVDQIDPSTGTRMICLPINGFIDLDV